MVGTNFKNPEEMTPTRPEMTVTPLVTDEAISVMADKANELILFDNNNSGKPYIERYLLLIRDRYESDRQKLMEEAKERANSMEKFMIWADMNEWTFFQSDLIWIRRQDYMNGKTTSELYQQFLQTEIKQEHP